MHQHITLSLNRIIAGIKNWLASRKLFKNHLINQRKNHAQGYIVYMSEVGVKFSFVMYKLGSQNPCLGSHSFLLKN